MALIVWTKNPSALWSNFSTAIEDDSVKTWAFHEDGKHFTHTSEQWSKKAWFHATMGEGMLIFNIIKPVGKPIKVDVYAEYHALLLRVLLANFDQQFSNVNATALAESGDLVAER